MNFHEFSEPTARVAPRTPETGRLSTRAEYSFRGLVGISPRMIELYRFLEEVAPSTASVLFVGESGTGKELAARTLHELSSRRSRPFLAVNCAAIPETLLEGELFGHEQGAFTGATTRRAGCFELAHEGTLFLDELTAMPTGSQSKLLRALEERSFRRLRGTEEIRVDVRVIAAVNEDPERAVGEGRLREDLYYRINVFQLTLAPLRERSEDIIPLASHFLRHFAEANAKEVEFLSAEARSLLKRHDWPGNVRELRNVIERAVILSTGSFLEADHLPPHFHMRRSTEAPARVAIPQSPGPTGDSPPPVGASLQEATRWLVLRTLESTDYNKTRAASVLGVSVKTVYNKLREWSELGDRDAALAVNRCRERSVGAVPRPEASKSPT